MQDGVPQGAGLGTILETASTQNPSCLKEPLTGVVTVSSHSTEQPEHRACCSAQTQHTVPLIFLHPAAEQRWSIRRRRRHLYSYRCGSAAVRCIQLPPSVPRQPDASSGQHRLSRLGCGLLGVPQGCTSGYRALLLGVPRLVGALRW